MIIRGNSVYHLRIDAGTLKYKPNDPVEHVVKAMRVTVALTTEI